MSEEDPSTLQRILVALDGSPHSQAALDAAVRMAITVEAKVEGVFVEDETLLRASQLPFAKEVRTYTTSPQRLTDHRVERQLRYQASYAEHSLRHFAQQAEISHDFQTIRGRITDELLELTSEVDLLVLGKTSTASSRRRLGATCRALLSKAASPVLVLRKAVPTQQPLLLYYDGSDSAEAALRIAAQLVRKSESLPLDILLPGSDEARSDRLRDRIQTRYEDLSAPLRLHPLTRAENQQLSVFARPKGGVVVLPEGCPSLCNTSLQQFLYEIDRPLLVVR